MFFRTKGDFLRITLEDKVFGIRLVTGGENALYFELLEKIVERERSVWIVDEIDEPIGGLDGGGSFGQNLAVRLLGGDRSAGGFPVGKRDGEACDQGSIPVVDLQDGTPDHWQAKLMHRYLSQFHIA